ncbi:phosphatidylserine decarboxylase 1 KNAG_0F01350 [Huiozyma naganishii CBS 8797]|uniref:Phosphatidylserine decarboxylase proenzyme 1, mitochondrial n=1 Tax=Huiozyma naganishii (strain ATCC MYA-139 / BCRC 22969 / CBS 8797 / KCTC 17520 / NBRC 10181 / NCYC 3082 / Yp74L-3) TaxID=1071383 RepID=J7RMK8_HUIN7|nr:hypothetical protein KNAG_0F01350 [Kazachstania naganishii CBS 8797]CCK70803.1 hypothetical protein KNAG_0F01350 [Kazachstania naganishii CBS 8797]
MLVVRTALANSKMKLMEIRPRIALRNRTADLWRRKFSTRLGLYEKLHPPGDKKTAATCGSKKAAKILVRSIPDAGGTSISMKWAVVTGVTIMLGTILIVSRAARDNDEEESLKEGKRTGRYQRIKIFNNNWMFFCYSTLPLNAMSRLWGQFNHLALPMWFRPHGYKLYSHMFGVKLDEMQDPDLYHYRNLAEFFYRTIRPETRPIAEGEGVVASPSDGRILQLGIISSETGEIEQVKGMTYSLKEFLGTHSHPLMAKNESSLSLDGDELKHREFAKKNNFRSQDELTPDDPAEDSPPTNTDHSINFQMEGDKSLKNFKSGGSKTLKLLSELSSNIPYYNLFNSISTEPPDSALYFAVIYLSPGDYHHYHSPTDWVCKTRRHFPGDLFSVSPYFQRNLRNLFVLNERVALLGYWKYGFFSMTPVGATNVGSIKLTFDKELVTNVKRAKHTAPHTCYEATYSNASKVLGGMPLVKGEEMGGFELGSTVVLCFEAPSNFKFDVKIGDKIKMGERLGAPAELESGDGDK